MNILNRVFHGRIAKTPTTKVVTISQTVTEQRIASNRQAGISSFSRRSIISSRGLIGSQLASDLSPPQCPTRPNEKIIVKEEEQETPIKMILQDHPAVGGNSNGRQSSLSHGEHRYEVYENENESHDLDDDVRVQEELTEGYTTPFRELHHESISEHEDHAGDIFDGPRALIANLVGSLDYDLTRDEPIPSIEHNDHQHHEAKVSPSPRGEDARLPLAGDESGSDVQDASIGKDFESDLTTEREDGFLVHEDDLQDYVRHKREIPGVESWPREACRLYKLLYLRGLFPVMPSEWEWPLNRSHPLPAQLFMPADRDNRALIRAEKSAFHGTSQG